MFADKASAVNMNMPGMKGMQARTQQLKASKGEAFDRMFLDVMTMHHQHGMPMLTQAQANAQRPEIKDMAKRMSDSQKEDVQKMQAWEKSGVTPRNNATHTL